MASEGPWVTWYGGNCPVPWAYIIAKLQSGYVTQMHQAGKPRLKKFWKHEAGNQNIIAYRVVTP